MILAMNIGNSNLALAVKENERINVLRSPVGLYKSKRDFILFIGQLTSKKVDGVIISSVKPELTDYLVSAVTELYGIKPLVVNRNMNTAFDLSAYDTRLVGSDRIAVCEAASSKHRIPAVIFDFGTAITVNVIDNDFKFLGGAILSGISMSLKALAKDAALLPESSDISNAVLIGRNTLECMTSGVVYGCASMLDGMVRRIEDFLGYEMNVLVTGGNARDVIPFCFTRVNHQPELLIEGLFYLYYKNTVGKEFV